MGAALSAADPANPFGTAVPWPPHAAKTKPTRRPGAIVVIMDGQAILWLSPGGRHLLTFAEENSPVLRAAVEALVNLLLRSRGATFTLESINDTDVAATPLADLLAELLAKLLREAGFSYTPRGLCWYSRLSAR